MVDPCQGPGSEHGMDGRTWSQGRGQGVGLVEGMLPPIMESLRFLFKERCPEAGGLGLFREGLTCLHQPIHVNCSPAMAWRAWGISAEGRRGCRLDPRGEGTTRRGNCHRDSAEGAGEWG